MTKSGWKKWLCTVTATMGMGSMALAGDARGFINTDSVFGEDGNNIRLVSNSCTTDACAPDACAPTDPCCPGIGDACDAALSSDGCDAG